MPLEALRPVAMVWILGMTGILAWLWYRGRISRKLAAAVLVVSAAFGFLFTTIAPWQLQLLLMGSMGGPLAFTLAILGLFLVLSLFLGRVFCSALCPLGALQELASLAPVPKLKIRAKLALYTARFMVLGIIIVSAVFFSMNILVLFGVADLFLLTLSPGTLVMVSLLVLSVVFYRPFCRILCPYGAFLSLAGLVSLFKLRRNPSCIECGKCEFTCPVDEAKREDLKGECYLCGRCTEVCPVKGAITYRRGKDAGGRGADPDAVRVPGGGE